MNVREFEEMSMNAWPALSTIHYDGWIMRFADGVTRRANSINPIYSSSKNIDKKIDFCHDIYQNSGQKTIYKITPLSLEENIDAVLESKNYKKEAITSMKSIDLEEISLSNSVDINNIFSDNWLLRFMKFINADKSKFDIYKSIFKNIKMKTCYIDFIKDGNYVGCGLGVLEDDYIGIFDVVVDDHMRNRGYGRTIVESIMCWGFRNGAKHAYLQCMIDNLSAQHLYKKIGFKEKYQYWYRCK